MPVGIKTISVENNYINIIDNETNESLLELPKNFVSYQIIQRDGEFSPKLFFNNMCGSKTYGGFDLYNSDGYVIIINEDIETIDDLKVWLKANTAGI